MAKFSCQRQKEIVNKLTDDLPLPTNTPITIHVAQRVLDVLCNFLNGGSSKVAFLRNTTTSTTTESHSKSIPDLVDDLYHCRIPVEDFEALRGVPLLLSLMNDDDKDVRMFAIYALTLLAENETTQSFVVKCSLYPHLFRIWLTENGTKETATAEEDDLAERFVARAVAMKRTDHEIGNVAYVVRHLLKVRHTHTTNVEFGNH